VLCLDAGGAATGPCLVAANLKFFNDFLHGSPGVTTSLVTVFTTSGPVTNM
jgi:hypothetical protein